jgi:calcium/calmodulin-dependent protein kinase kinase 2
MKKLDHPNLVSLIEVLDDPREDSLYMVMEMCKKGVVMRVGLDQRADPYPDDACRYWFRDLLLGIEYLHAQGVVHRDIKPDNCLVTDDDVLKIVDFGVSEMFAKDSDMMTAKSAGSPAFLPPELCVAKHGDVSGKAADIWSMGVTLYCLKYGHIPFEKSQIFEMYESIKTDQPDLTSETDDDFRDLMIRILEKDASMRIRMPELRVSQGSKHVDFLLTAAQAHPWVTRRGKDPLLSEKENTANLVEPPTEAEMNAAITKNMRNLMTVVKAVKKFKALTADKRQPTITSILGDQEPAHFSQPPQRIRRKPVPLPYLGHKSHSEEKFDRTHREGELVTAGVHRDLSAEGSEQKPSATLQIPIRSAKAVGDAPKPQDDASSDTDNELSRMSTGDDARPVDLNKLPPFRSRKEWAHTTDEVGQRGHARDPLADHLYLFIGPSTISGPGTDWDRRSSFIPGEYDIPIVSESPGAADVDIYETAYRDEVERILARAREEQKEPNVYLNRRMDDRLLALSGWVGRRVAGAEEAASTVDYYTQFSARKARVTEVSRALRHAAREEYEKRRQEKRAAISQAKAEKAKAKEEGGGESTTSDTRPMSPDVIESPMPMSPGHRESLRASSTLLKGKAVDKGRQAKTSFRGLMDAVKSRTKSGDQPG